VAAVAIAALVAVVAAGLIVAGNPVGRIEQGWHSFKGGYGTSGTSGDRLISGLGSNRYDFYRVALDEFSAHPIIGIGADNFQQQYLAHGHSGETPHYPHSIELRTLSQTGLIGALLALVGLGAALLAAATALREPDPLVRSVAAAAFAGFGYWVVHGSLDWFWEFAGLGAPAFALLGIACSLAPARVRAAAAPDASAAARPATGRRRLLLAVASIAAIAAAVSLTAPWLSQLQIESAARVWRKSPSSAYARLRDAARLNPLSDEANLTAGSIALRYGDLARAEREFSAALARTPGDAYATLERGAIASSDGERQMAMALLERAVRLNPRDELTREALAVVQAGRRIDVAELNRQILGKARELA
jgi:tetratricopeptide (TPR) repeat protein